MEKIGMEAILEMSNFLKGKNVYISGTDQMVDKTEKGTSIFSKMGGALESVAKVGIGAAVAGIGALTAVIIDSVQEAANAQKVDAQLDAVLKATGGTAGMTKDAILALADSLSRVTPYEDDMIAATETVLLQFRSIGKDVFPQATEMALDLATRLGIDTTSAAKLLGKALEEPGEGLARLKQAGIAFTDEQEAMIKKMVESGDTAGAQKYIMDRLGESIGGAARAAGDTFAGKMTILQNSIGNVKESIGAAFLPVLTELVDKFSAFVQDNAPAIEAFFQGIADWIMNKAIPAILELYNWFATYLPPAIQTLSDFWTNTLQPALAAIWEFIKTSVIPVLMDVYNWLATNIPIAIQILSDFWTNTLQPALLAIWDFVQNSLIPAFLEIYTWLATNIPPAIQTLSDFWTGTLQPALQAVWDFIQNNVIPIFQKVAEWFSGEGTTSTLGWVDTIKNFLGPIIDFAYEQFSFIVDWVKENWPLIQKTVKTVMEAVRDIIDKVLTIVKKIVETVLGAIKDFWQEHGDKIMDIVKSVWDIIKTTIDTVIKVIAGIIKAVMQAINGDWSGAWETIKGVLKTAWEGIKKIVDDAITIVKNVLAIAWDTIRDAVIKAWDAIKDKLNTAWESIKKVVDDSITAVKTQLAEAWDAMKTSVSEAWDAIKKAISDAWDAIKGLVDTGIQKFKDALWAGWQSVIEKWQGLLDWFKWIWSGIADWFYGIGKSIVQGIKQGLIDAWDNLVRWVQQQIKELKELIGELFEFGSPSKWAMEVGEMVTVGLGKGLEKGFQVPITAVLEGVQDVKKAMAGQLGGGMAMGYNRQAMTPAYAGAGQNVNVSFGDTTINNGLDVSLFQAQVLQTVTRAVRGY